MLWFDVENRYKTTARPCLTATWRLWFDVENRWRLRGNDKVVLT